MDHWSCTLLGTRRRVSAVQKLTSKRTVGGASGVARMNEPWTPTEEAEMDLNIDPNRQRFPFCIVWTPIPILTYFLPFIGHMGIATSAGVIRDFAGPYYVSEDNMAFGRPTKYWQLSCSRAKGGVQGWDSAVSEASEIYKTRMHNLCCDNCHSHVATALNIMQYDGSASWNMAKLATLMLLRGKYVSLLGFVRTWLPFCLILVLVLLVSFFCNYA